MASERIIEAKGFYTAFERKGGNAPAATHYCAGCGHGVLHKLIAEALVDLGIQDRAIMISPVGCAVFGYYYIDCGNVQAAHGRAPAVGAGICRSTPEAIVISYQGDGDLASIGLGHTLQAANRGERLAVLFVNNAVYGMTGGQMAPTTLVGQATTTCPGGRDPALDGYPIHACELINQFEAPVYIERCSLSTAAKVRKARAAVRKALQIQKEGKGYAFVEFLSPCPTNMKQGAVATANFLDQDMEREFPLGCLRDRSQSAVPTSRLEPTFDHAAITALFGEARPIGPATPPAGHPTERLKVAGFGGQGVLSLGMMIAQAGLAAHRQVTWFPSYGPEQRGGTANCSVVVSEQEVGSPYVSTPNVLIAMNQPSVERFAADVAPGGTILYDATAGQFAAAGLRTLAVPAFQMAVEAGDERAANTAMLGVLAAAGLAGLSLPDFENVLDRVFARKKKVLEINRMVFRRAVDWARRYLDGTAAASPATPGRNDRIPSPCPTALQLP